jgi:hypothetical protein
MSYADIILNIAKYFPTAVGTTLFVGGLATARMPWVVASLGMATLSLILITIHFLLRFTPLKGQIDALSGGNVFEVCALTPVPDKDSVYFSAPSMWVSLTTYLMMLFILSAARVATANPTTAAKEALPVQQRKGVGTLSILACIILFLFLLILRVQTGCETIVGVILGIGFGVAAGVGWWAVMRAGGPAVWDVHGVMLGVQPGSLRTGPLACLPVGRA